MKLVGILLPLFFIAEAPLSTQYVGDTREVTVQKVLEMPNQSNVILKGYLVRKTGSEEYVFKDNTGEIKVAIEDEIWGNRRVDSFMKIKIIGELEKSSDFIGINVVKFDYAR